MQWDRLRDGVLLCGLCSLRAHAGGDAPAGVAQSRPRAPASPLAMFSENASICQPRSRFAQQAAAPALQAPEEAAGIDVRVSAEKNSGAAQTDARVQSAQQKGASAPAVLTRQSWPGLVSQGPDRVPVSQVGQLLLLLLLLLLLAAACSGSC